MLETIGITRTYEATKTWITQALTHHNEWRSKTWTFDSEMTDFDELRTINAFHTDLKKSGLFSGFQSMKLSFENANKFFHALFYTTIPNAASDFSAGTQEIYQSFKSFLTITGTHIATGLGRVFGPILGAFHGFSVAMVGLIGEGIAHAANAYDNEYQLKDNPHFETSKTVAAYAMTAYMLYKSAQFIRGLFNPAPAKLLADREKTVRDQEAALALKMKEAEKTIEDAAKAAETIEIANSRIILAGQKEKSAAERESAAALKLQQVTAANGIIEKALRKQQKTYLTRAALVNKASHSLSNVSSSNSMHEDALSPSSSSSSASSNDEANAANDSENDAGRSPMKKRKNTLSSSSSNK